MKKVIPADIMLIIRLVQGLSSDDRKKIIELAKKLASRQE